MIDPDPRPTALVLIDPQNGILGREPVSPETLIGRGQMLAKRYRAV